MPTEDDYSFAGEEFTLSYSELMQSTPHEALLNFYQRHDELIEEISEESGQQRACFDGCAYCCYLKVIADAVEIFAMVDYARAHLTQTQIDKVIQTSKDNIEQARDLSHKEHAMINQRCPFLQDNRCLVYPQRPIKCRNYHSTDASNCRRSFDHPKDLTILNSNITDLYIAATGSTHGFYAALHQHGYDDRIYDLNAAFIEALADDSCRTRYVKGKRAFRTARYDNE